MTAKNKIRKYICPVCNKEFQDFESNHRKYCSKKCWYIILKEKMKKNVPWNKDKKLGPRPLKVRLQIARSHIGIFPSETTRLKMSLNRKGRPSNRKNSRLTETTKLKLSQYRGPLNSQWKGGITPLSQQIRQSFEYKLWRNKVFERDNFTCQACQQRSRKNFRFEIEAHHKKSFEDIIQEFLKEFNQFSPIEDKETLVRLAITYKPFWDLNNGKTLCQKCHNLIRGKNYEY